MTIIPSTYYTHNPTAKTITFKPPFDTTAAEQILTIFNLSRRIEIYNSLDPTKHTSMMVSPPQDYDISVTGAVLTYVESADMSENDHIQILISDINMGITGTVSIASVDGSTTTIKSNRKTAAQWTSDNTILYAGEIGIETDTRKTKYGDGSTAWNDLLYSTCPVDGSDVSLQVARDTDANLSALTDPFLSGQLVYNQTTGLLKAGDGTSTYSNLVNVQSPDMYAVVATAASPKKMRVKADYICSGTNDDSIIQDAIDDFGLVKLLPGTFHTTGMMTTADYGVLSGSGIGKTIIFQDKTTSLTTSDPIIKLGQFSTCENLTLNGNAWTDADLDTNGIDMGNYSLLQNCEITEVRQYAIYSQSRRGVRMINNISHNTKYPFVLRGEGTTGAGWSDGCIIANNLSYNCSFHTKIRAAKNCLVMGNIFRQSITNTTGSVLGLEGGDFPYENIHLIGNTCIDELGTGTCSGIHVNPDVDEISKNITIDNNIIKGFYYGITVGWNGHDLSGLNIKNNTLLDVRNAGILIKDITGAVLTNNTLTNAGILIQDSDDTLIKNNVITAGNRGGNALNSGIYIFCHTGKTSNNSYIEDNTIKDCTWGINIYKDDTTGIPAGTIISRNDLIRCTSTPIRDLTGISKIYDNNGYKTENTGAAQITTGSTSVIVSHGLRAAPTRINTTPGGNINCWVDPTSITATQFTISSTAPEADTTVFWSARIV